MSVFNFVNRMLSFFYCDWSEFFTGGFALFI